MLWDMTVTTGQLRNGDLILGVYAREHGQWVGLGPAGVRVEDAQAYRDTYAVDAIFGIAAR